MNPGELISPDVLLPLLQKRAEELSTAIDAVQAEMSKFPEGRLRMARRGKDYHYFVVTDSSSKWGTYLPKREISVVRNLAQKEYDEAAVGEMRRQLALIDRFIAAYHPDRLDSLYENRDGRKSLLRPLRLPDEQFANLWRNVPYEKNDRHSDSLTMVTQNGEMVRSKSEVIIAEVLDKFNVPYRYEFPYKLTTSAKSTRKSSKGEKGKKVTFCPDFTCLNLRTRKEFIWEHFGKMDDAEYVKNVNEKLDVYEANGIFLGDRLIITRETEARPLKIPQVQRLVKKFLL